MHRKRNVVFFVVPDNRCPEFWKLFKAQPASLVMKHNKIDGCSANCVGVFKSSCSHYKFDPHSAHTVWKINRTNTSQHILEVFFFIFFILKPRQRFG